MTLPPPPHRITYILWEPRLKYQYALRKYELYKNTSKVFRMKFWRLLYLHMGVKLGFDIPPNTFDMGLNIHHWGCIVVNGNARIGKNCVLQQCVNIGQNHDSEDVPTIGDNVFIGPGAKIFGKIYIADDIVIGAGAIVNKSFYEKGIAIAGNPAHKIVKGNNSKN